MAKIAFPQKAKGAPTQAPKPASDLSEIEALAYQFFVDRGYEHGHDAEDWLRAESIVRARKRA